MSQSFSQRPANAFIKTCPISAGFMNFKNEGVKLLESAFPNTRCDNRDRYTCRSHIGYSFIKEINLSKRSDGAIIVYLSFFPTMAIAKEYYRDLGDLSSFSSSHINSPRPSFHISMGRNGNIEGTYLSDYSSWPYDEYRKYWLDHLSLLKASSPAEVTATINVIPNIKDSDKAKIESAIKGKTGRPGLCIVPEITVDITWSQDDMANIHTDLDFRVSLIDAVEEVINKAGLSVPPRNGNASMIR